DGAGLLRGPVPRRAVATRQAGDWLSHASWRDPDLRAQRARGVLADPDRAAGRVPGLRRLAAPGAQPFLVAADRRQPAGGRGPDILDDPRPGPAQRQPAAGSVVRSRAQPLAARGRSQDVLLPALADRPVRDRDGLRLAAARAVR